MRKITFAIYDLVLNEMIKKGILPHLPADQVRTHMGMSYGWSRSKLLVVAVSAITDRTDIATIMEASEQDQPCGVIALSPSALKWDALRERHRYRPFKCFVAAGVETRFARNMIPRLDILSDIGDLVIPGKSIAEYLWKAVPPGT